MKKDPTSVSSKTPLHGTTPSTPYDHRSRLGSNTPNMRVTLSNRMDNDSMVDCSQNATNGLSSVTTGVPRQTVSPHSASKGDSRDRQLSTDERPRHDKSSSRKEVTPEQFDSPSVRLFSTHSGNDYLGSTTLARAEVGLLASRESPPPSPDTTNMDALSTEVSSGFCPLNRDNAADALEVGHVIDISIRGKSHSGVVRWLGTLPGDVNNGCVAGLEMDVDNELFSDGTYSSKRYFTCPPQRGLFVYADQCKKDPRLHESTITKSSNCIEGALEFGDIECPFISGCVHPFNINISKVRSICGRNKGIQGHHNSCYLDATLFSMFTFTDVFDSILFRQKMAGDIPEYDEVQKVLHQAIVNPLRTNMYVRADNVLKLRFMLDKLGSVTGLTCEEKDPEEFLNSLLQQIMKAKPFLKLSSGQESFYYQLFVEKKERITFPTVQYLLQQSFYSSNIKLRQEPSCLIILMPRFGKQYKVYPRIFPTLDLDVSEIIENAHRVCSSCGKLSEYECLECFQESEVRELHCSFCEDCLTLVKFIHQNRQKHRTRKLLLSPELLKMKDRPSVKPIEMKLFAVVCIETSHYVAFVKCGKFPDSPWCFFDSMADRKGGQNGFNIPEVAECHGLNFWLSSEGYRQLETPGIQPPDYVKRLLSDAYLCMYYSPTVSMYS